MNGEVGQHTHYMSKSLRFFLNLQQIHSLKSNVEWKVVSWKQKKGSSFVEVSRVGTT